MKRVLPSVFILTLTVFLTGLAENIFIGVLPEISTGLNISQSSASSLISLFSIAYAVYAPFAAIIAHHVNAKSAIIFSLTIFAGGNLAMFLPGTELFFINGVRIITAMASAQISVCAVILAVSIVDENFKARAIGIIYLGISGSLFLGVPLGIWFTHLSDWRINGLIISSLSGLTVLFIVCKLPQVKQPEKIDSFKALFIEHFVNLKQVCGQIVSIFFIAGHFILFTFLTSYASNKGFSGPEWETLLYLVFGLSGVFGGILAGTLSDLLGRKIALLLVPLIYIVATTTLALSNNTITFFCSLAVWAAASWSISPVVQSYLIDLKESPRDIVIGANTTAMHVGVATGAALGSQILIQHDTSILPVGAISLVVIAFGFAIVSICLSNHSTTPLAKQNT